MQHEAASGFHRTAFEDLNVLRPHRQFDALGRRDHLELHQQIGELDVAGRMVDDDAHGALARMRADVDHRARKPLVVHRRHRDQHLTIEIAARRGLASRFAGKLHGKRVSNQSVFATTQAGLSSITPPSYSTVQLWRNRRAELRLTYPHNEFSGECNAYRLDRAPWKLSTSESARSRRPAALPCCL